MLRTPGTRELIRVPNFFPINNWYCKTINTRPRHSKTVHLLPNSWQGSQALPSGSEKWALSLSLIVDQLLFPKFNQTPWAWHGPVRQSPLKTCISLPWKFIMEPKKYEQTIYTPDWERAFNLDRNYDWILIWPLVLWKNIWKIIQNWTPEIKGMFLVFQKEKSGLSALERKYALGQKNS